MRYLIAMALCLPLSGCWFVYIPGGALDAMADSFTDSHGTLCVADTVRVGDQIRQPDGILATVKKINGLSNRCANPARPIRVEVSAHEYPNR